MAKLLAAREDICNVVKTSSGSIREKTACAVNKVRMGRVPDRGGRPSEIDAPPPEMPPWQKRQDGGVIPSHELNSKDEEHILVVLVAF
ncbi:hypothetical protein F2P81_003316 [Scophthalmus maximus]|uniref:Uncharacterized protein n=1 Tax=Scophthalmus maximus TaxID=52904 RepID=A0A6A4TI54_SCOMX|nr:hypothetical protein F2P81_003316 [Scophthalmus maximus]